LKEADERARIVAWCRTCAANNGLLGGTSALREVKSLTDRDARMFAFIADAIERGDHAANAVAPVTPTGDGRDRR
jgi:hypothetical protein